MLATDWNAIEGILDKLASDKSNFVKCAIDCARTCKSALFNVPVNFNFRTFCKSSAVNKLLLLCRFLLVK